MGLLAQKAQRAKSLTGACRHPYTVLTGSGEIKHGVALGSHSHHVRRPLHLSDCSHHLCSAHPSHKRQCPKRPLRPEGSHGDHGVLLSCDHAFVFCTHCVSIKNLSGRRAVCYGIPGLHNSPEHLVRLSALHAETADHHRGRRKELSQKGQQGELPKVSSQ